MPCTNRSFSRFVRPILRLTPLLSLAGAACTALGPMPGVTGVSAVPAARPDVELQVGAVPGYYLSSAVQEEPRGTSLEQIAVTFEPDRWLSLPGVFAGLRRAGADETHPATEPMVGYRTFVENERQLALAAVGYGTYASGQERGASYSAVRGGLELGADLRLTPISKVLELHAFAATALTGLSAEGTYCADADRRFGLDCEEPGNAALPRLSAEARGLYPAVSAGFALEFARHLDTFFHGGRLTLGGAAGTMPRVVGGEQVSASGYTAVELLLSLALGAR
jgi:hypothetical protein